MATALWIIMHVLFVIYVKCLLIEGLVTTIDVTVVGEDVLKSGVRLYSVYGSRLLSIECSLNSVVQPHVLSILRNNSPVEDSEIINMTKTLFIKSWKMNIPVEAVRYDVTDKYTCSASFSVPCNLAVNGTRCHSEIYSEVEVRVETLPSIASDIGHSGYIGEEISINCIDKYESNDSYHDLCKFHRGKSTTSLSNIPVDNALNKYGECSWFYYSQNNSHFAYPEKHCRTSVLRLHVLPNLNLSLIPSSFLSNVTTLQFSCTSVPPRLMRWTIITDNGDIMDFRSSNDAIKISMNITITQKSGETTLKLSEATSGGNGILFVICSSYDTLSTVSVSSYRVFIDKRSEGNAVATMPSTMTVPSTTSAIDSTVMYQQGTTTNYDSSYTTEEQPTEGTNLTQNFECQKPNCKLCAECMLFKVLLLFVTTLVCTLAAVVLMLLRKARLAVASTNKREENDQQPETILHDNPVYQSYSETPGSSADDEKQHDVSLYYNL